MTTKDSPIATLKAQADIVAKKLKSMTQPPGREFIKFAVVMDDKLFTVEMPWQAIHESDEGGIAEFILNEMRERREKLNA